MTAPVVVGAGGTISFDGTDLGIVAEPGVTISNQREHMPLRYWEAMQDYDAQLIGVTTTLQWGLREWTGKALVAAFGALDPVSVDQLYIDHSVLQSATNAYGPLVVTWEDEGVTYSFEAFAGLCGIAATSLVIAKNMNAVLNCSYEVMQPESGTAWRIGASSLAEESYS